MSWSSDNSSDPEFKLIDANTREWIDARSSWVLDQFGRERIRSCSVVLPSTEFFPQFSSGAEGARDILDRLCGYMGIEPRSVDLALFYESQGTDGAYPGGIDRIGDRFSIWVEISQLDMPVELTGTMAFGLSQIHLLGHGRLCEDAEDRLPLAELLTVFLGLGVIMANSALHDVNWQSGGWQGLEIRKSSYSTMQMYGYALALFTSVRDDTEPAWRKNLRPDVRDGFQRSLKFFAKHGLPDLHRVRTTRAFPSIELFDEETNAEEAFHPEATRGDFNECSFCGEPVPVHLADEGVCGACQSSIDDNQVEIEAQREFEEHRSIRNTTIIKWGCFGFVAMVVVLIAVQLLGLFP